MASTNILNAAPMVIARGIQDLSTRELPADAEALPTHLPKVYLYAQKGPSVPTLVTGSDRVRIFGEDSFDLRKPFATHQTVLSNLVAGQGNAQMIERIIPADCGPRANFCLWLDIVADDIVQYQRNADGSFVVDAIGDPVPATPAATLPGYKAKWVVTRISDLADETDFGNLTSVPGDQTNSATPPVQSTRYPILQFWASSYGSVFNDSGVRLWAPTEASVNPVNAKALADMGAYPFRLSVIKRASANETPTVVSSQYGEQFLEFVLKPGAIYSYTDSEFSLQDTFLKNYQSIENDGSTIDFGEFGGFKVYEANLATILGDVYASESAATAVASDFTGAAGEEYLVNLFSGVSSKNEPYYTFKLDTTAANAQRLSESSNIYAGGAADGTMDEAAFASAVASRVAAYADPNSALMDTAVHVESIIYDTGFPLATKKALCKFISERKDTFVVLSTYDVNGPEMTASQEHSVAAALKTYLQMYPESDYFGTSTVRGLVMGRYGVLTGSNYKKKLPVTLELAVKAAKMMGASNGKWKEAAVFDRAPNNEISLFEKINVTFTPTSVRNKDWELGLNWVQSYTRNRNFFPALKTVCDDDTSVLNSFFTVMCAVELQKVGERVWRDFTGSVRLTNEQLIDRVNAAVEERTLGRFADMYKIVPEAYLTGSDELRGYSWTLPITLYANNMKTVMTLDVRARRMTDLAVVG